MKNKITRDSLRTITFLYLWLLTIIVFFILIFSSNGEISGLKQSILFTDFLSGIIFFLFIFISAIIDRSNVKFKNKTFTKFFSSVLFSLLLATLTTGTIFGFNYSSKNNTQLKQEAITSSPNLIQKTLPDEIFEKINSYRNSKKLSPIFFDKESCEIAERVANTPGITDLKLSDYKDICPSCTGIGFNQSIDIKDGSTIIDRWKADKTTLTNLETSNKYGCVKQNNSLIIFISTAKLTTVTNSKNYNNTNTTSANSDDPNAPVHCNINSNCGGGTKPLKKWECEQSICCQVSQDKWELIIGKEKCDSVQKANGEINIPTGDKKVQYTTTEAIIDGTYYCYESKVNELSRMEQNIKFKTIIAGDCKYEPGTCSGTCIEKESGVDSFGECINKCNDTYAICYKRNTEIGNLRRDYESMLRAYCP